MVQKFKPVGRISLLSGAQPVAGSYLKTGDTATASAATRQVNKLWVIIGVVEENECPARRQAGRRSVRYVDGATVPCEEPASTVVGLGKGAITGEDPAYRQHLMVRAATKREGEDVIERYSLSPRAGET